MTKEDKLLNETRKRMQQLYEYSFYNNGVFEDGEPGADPNAGAPAQDPNAMGGDPNMMGGDPNAAAPAGGDPNAMGADPNAMGADPNAMGGDPNAMGGDPNAAAPAGGVDGANLAPNAGMDGGDPSMMGGDMGSQPCPDDDVVDITQLTDAQDELKANQEQTAEQLEDVDSKLSTLLNVVNKFTQALDANDAKIAELKSELIKRTPTEEETMNVRLTRNQRNFGINSRISTITTTLHQITRHLNTRLKKVILRMLMTK